MLVMGFGLLWVGYSISSWGYVLIKGWNIPLSMWMNPVNPYKWPPNGQDPPKIPQGRVWPQHSGGLTTTDTGTSDQALQNDVTPGAA
jgi:hypothetical protein